MTKREAAFIFGRNASSHVERSVGEGGHKALVLFPVSFS